MFTCVTAVPHRTSSDAIGRTHRPPFALSTQHARNAVRVFRLVSPHYRQRARKHVTFPQQTRGRPRQQATGNICNIYVHQLAAPRPVSICVLLTRGSDSGPLHAAFINTHDTDCIATPDAIPDQRSATGLLRGAPSVVDWALISESELYIRFGVYSRTPSKHSSQANNKGASEHATSYRLYTHTRTETNPS